MGEIIEFPSQNRRERENVNRREVSNLRISRNVYKKSNKSKFSLKKMLVAGVVLTMALGAVSNYRDRSKVDSEVPPISESEPESIAFNNYNEDKEINTSTDSLSSCNVVLVNDNFDNSQFNDLQMELNAAGLKFEVEDIGSFTSGQDETLISFINYGGDEPVVIANYEDGNNHADLLALGMAASFSDDKVSGDDIRKGVTIMDSAFTSRGPSDIEKAVGDVMQPTVTLAVPYDYQIDTEFTDKVLEGLARYTNYFADGSFYDESYLYRVKPGDGYYSLDKDTIIANDLSSDVMLQIDQMLLKKPLPTSFQKDTEVTVTKSEVKSLN